MHRNHLIIIALVCASAVALAKEGMEYPAVDSLSWEYYRNGQWDELDSLGRAAVRSGIDYPNLRMRLGYAQFVNQRYSRSLAHYQKALDDDAGNIIARLYQYWNNIYLNRREVAAAAASRMSDDFQAQCGLRPFRPLTRLDAEVSLSQPAVENLEPRYYGRVGLKTQLHWTASLYQSLALSQQSSLWPAPLPLPQPGRPPLRPSAPIQISDRQSQYYALLTFVPAADLLLKASGAYHTSSGGQDAATSQVGFAGIKYYRPFWDVQAGGAAGAASGVLFQQYDVQLDVYPLGNLDLYASGRIACQRAADAVWVSYGQTIGGKIMRQLWIEGLVTLRPAANYLEHDALYLNTAADASRYQGGLTLYYLTSANVTLRLAYTLEGKHRQGTNIYYQQHAITGGISWEK